MTQIEINMFQNVLVDIFSRIYPQDHDSLIDNAETQELCSSNEIQQLRINKYISVEYFNLYNHEYLTYSRNDGEHVYAIRIKIRPGLPYQLYHYINDK